MKGTLVPDREAPTPPRPRPYESPGPYEKGRAKRREILDAALELIAVNGYGNTSVQQIADAANLTKAGLLYHFGSKENLLTEVLRRRDERDVAAFTNSGAAEPRITRIVRHNSEVPGLVELYSALVQEGVDPEHPAHDFFSERFRRVTGNVRADIGHAVDAGELRQGLDAEMLSRILIAVADGLQQQWQYDRSIDMAAHLDYLWSLLGEGGTA
ncbi:TetR/AcrR family transcriptional regulator [Nonomuraea turcica]|uniref:TetR/AcrR family transcriptional regulator n=1 Tax=Nonomuraea sp. G32 TaxID=3067274 RepID=UPI00273A8FCA|nr:TetR/AcrR family transcriptional regulator [Nonomuraea sp. G32]MDP4502492.1 TetR/AcrR family transcriptional regulator [Nonomuraea sp. G32]